MSQPLRVLHICQSTQTVQPFLRDWLNFLRQREVDVYLACNAFSEDVPQFKAATTQLFHLTWGHGSGFRQEVAALVDLSYLFTQYVPDIVHTYDLRSRFFGGWFARRHHTPVALHSDSEKPTFLNLLMNRWMHHEVVVSGRPMPRRTILPDGLPDMVQKERLYGLYRHLWSRHGGEVRRGQR